MPLQPEFFQVDRAANMAQATFLVCGSSRRICPARTLCTNPAIASPTPSEGPPLENAHPSTFKRIAGYIAGWKHRSDVLLGLSDEPRGDSVRRKGQTFGYRAYNGEGKLHSEELRLPNVDDEWKIYEGKGVYSFRRANP